MNYNQELPEKVEKQLDDYIARIKAIKLFRPKADLKKSVVEKQVKLVLETFGVKAKLEFRQLKTIDDWNAAWNAARGAAWDAALGAARGAAWDAARGAADILALNLADYKKKFPKGNFINLIPLWELGLYPVGVVDGKFLIYVPPSKTEFPKELK